MIIRSQDKNKITNFNQISDLVVSKKDIVNGYDILVCYTYFAESDCGFSVIATYSTEEKAIKVLDMIQDTYRKSFEEEQQNYVGHRYNVTFQMPQDSEVVV